MIVTWLLGGLLGALIIVHMVHPRVERRILSAARFFKELPPARHHQPRWRWGNPLLSRPLYLQLLGLLLLLAATLSSWVTWTGRASNNLGLWLLVDTSASMSTRQDGETRMAAAHREINQILAEQVGREPDLCVRLSTFDLERQDLLTTASKVAIQQAAANLKARAMGTDLTLIRGLFDLLDHQATPGCVITKLLVISDLPAPEWVAERPGQLVWRDVGSVVDNLGFTSIRAARNVLTGLVREVNLEITAFGQAPADARLVVIAPGGLVLLDEALAWPDDQTWRGSFSPIGPGQYSLRLSPGGAYTYDDQAIIEIQDNQVIRVDWHLADRHWLEQLGWAEDKTVPHLRVVPFPAQPDNVPTLLVGNGYQGANTSVEILDFSETSPLVADLNFDVAESLHIRGIELGAGFRPIVRGTDGLVWLAQRDNPPAAYVPGLPTGTDDNLGRFSAAAFFNAVRWLLQERSLPSLYTLTTPEYPEPEGNRLALHQDEGNTTRMPRSFDSVSEVQPIQADSVQNPVWPILLALAVLLFLIERGLAAFGGEKWR